MTHCFGRPEGFESLVRLAENLCEEILCLKFCLASIFPVSQPQGWELQNKDTQRKLAP